MRPSPGRFVFGIHISLLPRILRIVPPPCCSSAPPSAPKCRSCVCRLHSNSDSLKKNQNSSEKKKLPIIAIAPRPRNPDSPTTLTFRLLCSFPCSLQVPANLAKVCVARPAQVTSYRVAGFRAVSSLSAVTPVTHWPEVHVDAGSCPVSATFSQKKSINQIVDVSRDDRLAGPPQHRTR